MEGLADTLFLIHLNEIGLFELLKEAGGVAGPWRDALEANLLRGLTDLGPADLAKTTPGRVRGRIRRKSGPLARHMKTYDLAQRVQFWFINKVFGVRQADITSQLQDADEGAAAGDLEARVRRSIQDVNKLFGTRQPGRPKKGGCLGLLERPREPGLLGPGEHV